MSTKKGLDKVLGWFVERDPDAPAAEDAPERTEAEVAPAPQAVAPAPPAPPATPPLAADEVGGEGFGDVYRAAGIPAADHDRTERALGLLRSLPPGVPVEARRAIVTASLAAFGIPIDRILETAATEIGALDAHLESGRQRADAALAGAQARIEALEGEIAEVRRLMDAEGRAQEETAAATGAERTRVRALLEFFGRAA
jgi:hypothetical protein